MKQSTKESVFACLFIAAMVAMFFCCALYGLSDRVWYADRHDSKCETLNNARIDDCGCYKRLVAAAKARRAKRNNNPKN